MSAKIIQLPILSQNRWVIQGEGEGFKQPKNPKQTYGNTGFSASALQWADMALSFPTTFLVQVTCLHAAYIIVQSAYFAYFSMLLGLQNLRKLNESTQKLYIHFPIGNAEKVFKGMVCHCPLTPHPHLGLDRTAIIAPALQLI